MVRLVRFSEREEEFYIPNHYLLIQSRLAGRKLQPSYYFSDQTDQSGHRGADSTRA
jgi:hypothetical protein